MGVLLELAKSIHTDELQWQQHTVRQLTRSVRSVPSSQVLVFCGDRAQQYSLRRLPSRLRKSDFRNTIERSKRSISIHATNLLQKLRIVTGHAVLDFDLCIAL